MLKYNICFIQRGEHILLLNRQSAAWMGSWNGVGGKLEPGETPEQSVIREIHEETGLDIREVRPAGVVLWWADGIAAGGMYAFLAALPADVEYETPRLTSEGILDWKHIDWILHPSNTGVAHNIPHFLPSMLEGNALHEYHCHFVNDQLQSVDTHPIQTSYRADLEAHSESGMTCEPGLPTNRVTG